MNIVKQLEPLEVLDPEGAKVRLGDLWKDKAVVVVFIRHFGCVFCKQQIAALLGIAYRIRARGADIVVIGNGSPEEAREFQREQKLPFRLLTDPSLASYRVCGFRRGVLSSVGTRVVQGAIDAYREGFRQSRTQGDPWQQGGALVIGAGGQERFVFASREAGHHPEPEQLIAALPDLK